MREFSQTEELFFLLDGIVRRDIDYDVKDEWTKQKIIKARDMAEAMFREERSAPKSALIETFPHAEAAQ